MPTPIRASGDARREPRLYADHGKAGRGDRERSNYAAKVAYPTRRIVFTLKRSAACRRTRGCAEAEIAASFGASSRTERQRPHRCREFRRDRDADHDSKPDQSRREGQSASLYRLDLQPEWARIGPQPRDGKRRQRRRAQTRRERRPPMVLALNHQIKLPRMAPTAMPADAAACRRAKSADRAALDARALGVHEAGRRPRRGIPRRSGRSATRLRSRHRAAASAARKMIAENKSALIDAKTMRDRPACRHSDEIGSGVDGQETPERPRLHAGANQDGGRGARPEAGRRCRRRRTSRRLRHAGACGIRPTVRATQSAAQVRRRAAFFVAAGDEGGQRSRRSASSSGATKSRKWSATRRPAASTAVGEPASRQAQHRRESEMVAEKRWCDSADWVVPAPRSAPGAYLAHRLKRQLRLIHARRPELGDHRQDRHRAPFSQRGWAARPPSSPRHASRKLTPPMIAPQATLLLVAACASTELAAWRSRNGRAAVGGAPAAGRRCRFHIFGVPRPARPTT